MVQGRLGRLAQFSVRLRVGQELQLLHLQVNQGINVILNTALGSQANNQVLAYNTPTTQKNYFRDTSFYLQDTWTLNVASR